MFEANKNNIGFAEQIKSLIAGEIHYEPFLKSVSILGFVVLAAGVIIFSLKLSTGAASGKLRMPFWMPIVQIFWGLSVAIAWYRSKKHPGTLGSCISFQGKMLCIAVVLYTAIMIYVSVGLYHPFGPKHSSRLAHLPGILSYGAAYGARMSVEFSNLPGSQDANRGRFAAKAGLVLGMICDIIVLIFIIRLFV